MPSTAPSRQVVFMGKLGVGTKARAPAASGAPTSALGAFHEADATPKVKRPLTMDEDTVLRLDSKRFSAQKALQPPGELPTRVRARLSLSLCLSRMFTRAHTHTPA